MTHNVAVNVFTNRVYATSCNSATALCSIAVIDGKTDTLITDHPGFQRYRNRTAGPGGESGDKPYLRLRCGQWQYIVIDGKTNTVITRVSVFTQPAGWR